MDDSARGVAIAAFTLQSMLLKALVEKGVLTRREAIEAVDNSLDAVASHPGAEAAAEAADIARICLSGVRERLTETTAR